MKGLERIKVVRSFSEKDSTWVHKELFRILKQDDIWILAYENLKSNKGVLTPGINPSTFDGMSLERLQIIKQQVIEESYKFKPVKQIMIPKSKGKLRPLGLPSTNDKIVQEVIRLILEAVYEPNFDKDSYGFRTGRGVHDALKHVDKTFRWMDWVIEGDIEGAYPTIDHRILCNLIEKRINDTRFMNLIRKALNCGVLIGNRVSHFSVGVPQGSIASPILSNIYFHELDTWVRQKAKELYSPPSKLRSSEYKRIEKLIAKYSKQMQILKKDSLEHKNLYKELKAARQLRLTVPSQKHRRIEVVYVRYADDWMIGVSGDKEIAKNLLDEVKVFFKEVLNQKLHPEKIKLTNLRKGKAYFLGYEIFLPAKDPITNSVFSGTNTRRRGNPNLRFDIPVNDLISKLINKGYIARKKKGVRPISKSSYVTLEDHVIVNHFRSVCLGILNFYSGCNQPKRLQYIHYLLHISCAMTLAHRHRTSSRQIFIKHGKRLTVKIPDNEKKTVSFPYRTSWSISDASWKVGKEFKDPFSIYANRVSRSGLETSCLVCGIKDTVESCKTYS
jgi:group II intron reverse transcriptase/maturase